VEGDIKASKRDRRETTLKDNIALSLLFFNSAIIAAIHDVLQHLLDLYETKFLGQLGLIISTNISHINNPATHTLGMSTFCTLR
jgi:hypothetical protein